jgi:hypothetical protein
MAVDNDCDYREAVDRLVAAYVDWREESIATREAYSRCDPSRGQKHRDSFAVYCAALDREELAAAEYADASKTSAPSSPVAGFS